jgi:3-hydroxyisobutyrate dehydrogenase-like beta-hydroxyacid dehydrogenase
MKIAFLGLGAMGSRMAARLLAAGHDLAVWNRSPDAALPLVAGGARHAATPRDAAAGAAIVFSMVTDDAAAQGVWLAPATGAADGLAPGAIAIECSTVTPGWVQELAAALAQRGASLLDAPVAGSRPQAEAGELVFMAGGEAAVLDAARPALAPLGARVLHVGRVGQGAVLKLAVNALFAAQLAAVAELLGYLGANGFATEEAAALLGGMPVVAPPLAGAARLMATRSTATLFTIDLLEKDLGYLLASGAELPGATATRALFRRAQQAGLGGGNVSGLAALFG